MAKIKSITDNVDVQISSDNLLETIVKKFGDAIVPGEERVEAITTGSLALDVSIGIGGIPRGRFTTMYGAEGSGKTTVALCTARDVINKGGKVLYVDAEIFLSYQTIESMLGEPLDPQRFILIHPETAEEAFIIIEELLDKVDLVIIDTVAALEPDEEKKKTIDKSTVAQISRLLPKFFRRDTISVKKANTAFLFLNQVRDKVGSYMGGYDMPGGHALKHWCSVIVFLSKKDTMLEGGNAVGITSKFVVKKNKLAPPFRSFTIPITFGKGIDSYMDLLEFCDMLGVIQKAGSYYKFDGETIGQGKFAASKFLEENPEITEKIKEQTYLVVKGNKSIEIPDDEFAGEEDLDNLGE